MQIESDIIYILFKQFTGRKALYLQSTTNCKLFTFISLLIFLQESQIFTTRAPRYITFQFIKKSSLSSWLSGRMQKTKNKMTAVVSFKYCLMENHTNL